MEVESQTCPQLAIVFVVNIQPEGCFKASGKIAQMIQRLGWSVGEL